MPTLRPSLVVVDPACRRCRRGGSAKRAGVDAVVELVVRRWRVGRRRAAGATRRLPSGAGSGGGVRGCRRVRWRTARRTGRRGRRLAAGVGRRRARAASGCASARSTMSCSAGVDSIPASSTTTVAPAGSRYVGSGGRSVRCHSWSSLATVSVGHPCLAFEDTGGLGRRCDTEHDSAVAVRGRRRRRRASVSCPRRPGRPRASSRSSPATDAAAAACIGSRPPVRTVVRRCRVVELGERSPRRATASSWARIASVVKCAAVGSIRTDRPSEARRETGVSGSRSTRPAVIWSVARSSQSAQSTPATAGDRSLQVAQRLQHVGAAPRRA